MSLRACRVVGVCLCSGLWRCVVLCDHGRLLVVFEDLYCSCKGNQSYECVQWAVMRLLTSSELRVHHVSFASAIFQLL